ncbi:MAG: fructose-bisphosphatase class III [Spirochaetae bacterium HGW-Spirochaetae-1]|jgi:fructose-1,6-bisphosphatase-3|nr:MAG: fructose-bisphosphatase class III [Spirochaetae bacterium HGW-Spirochaetae-1]
MNQKLSISSLHEYIKELAQIETELEQLIETTLWVSDPHGAGDRFVAILKGRFGLVFRSAQEALPKTFSDEKLDYLDRIIRKEKYFISDEYAMERQDVISSLVTIIRYKMQNIQDFDQIRGSINKDLRTLLENLLLNFPVPNVVYENTLIADKVISSLAKITKQVILGQLVVLGDVFDRGDEPDKILRILSSKEIKPFVKFVWGNHDILWMGAAAGNRSLIAEALRISFRYDNLVFVTRLGIDTTRLQEFASRLYPDNVSGNFKAIEPLSRKIEKTLTMIQFKLEEQTIKKYPQLDMDSRLNLEKLAGMLKAGDMAGLTDTHFPTLNPDNPLELTAEEREIIDDLAEQFTGSLQIKRLMEFLFREGKLYHVHNFILNIHALIPSTADGQFDELYGKKGKELLDYIEATVKDVGENYLNGNKQEDFQLAVMFYLWCGPKSPFFGKHAMKTFERYFFRDKDTHEEITLHWGENIQKDEFMDLIEKEFGAERVVYGHTPVNIMKGQKLASSNGRAINIDGGFSDAYLGRGHSLIHTPYSLFAIILPTEEELEESKTKKEPAKLLFEHIATYEMPKKIKDTWIGRQLQKRRKELLEIIMQYNS